MRTRALLQRSHRPARILYHLDPSASPTLDWALNTVSRHCNRNDCCPKKIFCCVFEPEAHLLTKLQQHTSHLRLARCAMPHKIERRCALLYRPNASMRCLVCGWVECRLAEKLGPVLESDYIKVPLQNSSFQNGAGLHLNIPTEVI